MGGSDPSGLTLRAARALARLDPIFRARFVIGPGMEEREKIAGANLLRVLHEAEVVAGRLQSERGPSELTIEELDGVDAAG